ncbi:hypothetical protein HMPREF0578_1952 [Mobiluncus mulieris 28-1]|nr:hypothetical protein HMPREF0578_1952 [Mobiluncus mulieris 28-1]
MATHEKFAPSYPSKNVRAVVSPGRGGFMRRHLQSDVNYGVYPGDSPGY